MNIMKCDQRVSLNSQETCRIHHHAPIICPVNASKHCRCTKSEKIHLLHGMRRLRRRTVKIIICRAIRTKIDMLSLRISRIWRQWTRGPRFSWVSRNRHPIWGRQFMSGFNHLHQGKLIIKNSASIIKIRCVITRNERPWFGVPTLKHRLINRPLCQTM